MNELLKHLVDTYRPLAAGGQVASYIPELSKADPSTLAIVVQDQAGKYFAAGDTAMRFTLQSVSKAFALALALIDNGPGEVFSRIGMEPTGDSFNSLTKLETFASLKPVNPLVNAGAITTTSLIKGNNLAEKFTRLMDFISALAPGGYVGFNESVYLSERDTGDRNRAIGYFLRDIRAVETDINETLELYFRQCSIEVDCYALATMASTLASEEENLIPREYRRIIRTFLFTCGMYDASGEFAVTAGIPAKSGVAGGIMAVVPGRYGIGVLGPALDRRGNSVSGVAVLQELSKQLGLYVF